MIPLKKLILWHLKGPSHAPTVPNTSTQKVDAQDIYKRSIRLLIMQPVIHHLFQHPCHNIFTEVPWLRVLIHLTCLFLLHRAGNSTPTPLTLILHCLSLLCLHIKHSTLTPLTSTWIIFSTLLCHQVLISTTQRNSKTLILLALRRLFILNFMVRQFVLYAKFQYIDINFSTHRADLQQEWQQFTT